MARRRSNFMIGLFVAVGVTIGVAALIWVGASKYFEEGALYATYFDESVQGLQVDSRVKYRGVDIGKVQSIGVAPDRKLVEVVMKIDLAGESEGNLVTQLRAAGITGIVFIELDRRHGDEPLLTPPLDMATRHPVIPSQLSQTRQMLTSVDRIMSRIGQIDLKGLVDQFVQTARAAEGYLAENEMKGTIAKLDAAIGSVERTSRTVEEFVAGKEIGETIARLGATAGSIERTADAVGGFVTGTQISGMVARLDAAAGSLERGAKRVDAVLASGEVESTLAEARRGLRESQLAMAELRELIAVVRREVRGLDGPRLAGRAGELLDGIDRHARALRADFERTTDEVRLAAESLRLLLDRVQQNPSDLLFSRPPVDDESRAGEEGR